MLRAKKVNVLLELEDKKANFYTAIAKGTYSVSTYSRRIKKAYSKADLYLYDGVLAACVF